MASEIRIVINAVLLLKIQSPLGFYAMLTDDSVLADTA
jgi:hypothetical protein